MIKSIISSFKIALTKAKIFIPLIIVSLIFQAILVVSAEFFVNFLDALSELTLTTEETTSYIIALFAAFPLELTALLILSIIGGIIGIFMLFIYSKIVLNLLKEKKLLITETINESKKRIKDIIAVFIFFAAVAFVFFVLFDAIINKIDGTGLFEGLFIIVGIIAIIVFIMYSFTVPIMAIENMKLKEALKKAWQFSEKHFLSVLGFFIILGVSIFLADQILRYLAGEIFLMLINLDISDILFYLIDFIITMFTSIIYFLAIPVFYLNKEYKGNI